MKRINRLWVGLGASAVVVAAAAGATLAITTLLGVTFEESEPKPAEGVETTPAVIDQPKPAQEPQPGSEEINPSGPAEGAQTAPYPGVAICVQAIDGDPAIEVDAKVRVETALLDVMQHRYWNIAGRGAAPPIVGIGCPEQPLTTRPGIQWMGAQPAGGDGSGQPMYTVDEPGFYNEYVFIMPLERINELLGGCRYALHRRSS